MDAQQHVNVAPADMMAALVASVASAGLQQFWGRTALHKTLFLAELDLHRGHAPMPGFRFYRFTFGPFSDELAVARERLIALGWLDEEKPWPTKAAMAILPSIVSRLKADPATGQAWLAIEETARKISTTYSDRDALCAAVYELRLAADDWLGHYDTTVREIPMQQTIIDAEPLGRAVVQHELPPAIARGIEALLARGPADLADSGEDSAADADDVASWLESGVGDPWAASSG